MATVMGAVEGCAPTDAGPSGRARCKKESGFAMLGEAVQVRVEHCSYEQTVVVGDV
jgi:hypothetical protein